jgi:hypothetical protein
MIFKDVHEGTFYNLPSAGFYTFEIPKGEDCFITVENSEVSSQTMLIQSSAEKLIKVVMDLDKRVP